jgi:hypothetical protein
MQKAPASKIWVAGQGVVDLESTRVDRAVREYDERLFFGRNMDNGQWCVFIKMPRGHDPEILPVLGFPEHPTPEEALDKIRRSDTKRYSTEIFKMITDSQERREREAEKANDENSDIYADIMQEAYRKAGVAPARIFVPKGV